MKPNNCNKFKYKENIRRQYATHTDFVNNKYKKIFLY